MTIFFFLVITTYYFIKIYIYISFVMQTFLQALLNLFSTNTNTTYNNNNNNNYSKKKALFQVQ